MHDISSARRKIPRTRKCVVIEYKVSETIFLTAVLNLGKNIKGGDKSLYKRYYFI